ncbi:hypothetical protein PYW07_015166 [Mythimna separata]|uniref:TIL domain-containing protein n=1 Tax=Mythimna separata TaxID=271217 RepID=A0AAD7YZI0_MYTSE|nr:hypothetical protein PYW07_015166 [Mythimna separata]
MTGRWLLSVTLVTHVLVLVACTGPNTQVANASPPDASPANSIVNSKPKKCKCRKAKKCPKNEEFSYCPQSIQRAQYCSEKAEPSSYNTESDKPCKEGCVCKENYLRAENGTCIPARECPLTCADNEVLDNCPSSCESDYCARTEADTFAKPCFFQEVCPPPACKCGFNRRRAANGTCILTRDCPPFDCTSRPNEEYMACPPLCPTDDCSQASPSGECPPQFGRIGIILPCNQKCRCRKGYWRLNGTCVPYGQCPGVCPDHERYSTCKQAECRALNCTQKDKPIACVRMDPKYCKEGCVCQEGYLRNKDGICVLEEKCEPTCPTNEEFVPCMQGVCRAKVCSERGQDVPCPDIPAEKCDSGCICKEGFLRAEDGSCVPEDQCLTCGENEVLDSCPTNCNTDNCPQSADEEKVCTKADPCVPACKCRFNYKRAKNNTCIPTRDCPPFDCSSKPNEEYAACPPLCPTDACYKPRLEGRCPFRIGIVLQCEPKCQCKDGYGRENGTCTPFEKCSNICPTNEVYSPCVQRTCRPQTCSERDHAMETCPTCDAADCKRGCVCQENYYRNDQGVCVPYKECEGLKCTNPHEVYEPKFQECPPNTCVSLVARFSCAENQKVGPACRCEDGYLRLNETESCVPICDCPQMKNSADCLKRV